MRDEDASNVGLTNLFRVPDVPTDRRTNGPMHRQTAGPSSYRNARMHLKHYSAIMISRHTVLPS